MSDSNLRRRGKSTRRKDLSVDGKSLDKRASSDDSRRRRLDCYTDQVSDLFAETEGIVLFEMWIIFYRLSETSHLKKIDEALKKCYGFSILIAINEKTKSEHYIVRFNETFFLLPARRYEETTNNILVYGKLTPDKGVIHLKDYFQDGKYFTPLKKIDFEEFINLQVDFIFNLLEDSILGISEQIKEEKKGKQIIEKKGAGKKKTLVFVFGKTGVGKSSFINTLRGWRYKSDDSSDKKGFIVDKERTPLPHPPLATSMAGNKSETSHFQAYHTSISKDEDVFLIDTPGFNDHSDDKDLSMRREIIRYKLVKRLSPFTNGSFQIKFVCLSFLVERTHIQESLSYVKKFTNHISTQLRPKSILLVGSKLSNGFQKQAAFREDATVRDEIRTLLSTSDKLPEIVDIVERSVGFNIIGSNQTISHSKSNQQLYTDELDKLKAAIGDLQSVDMPSQGLIWPLTDSTLLDVQKMATDLKEDANKLIKNLDFENDSKRKEFTHFAKKIKFFFTFINECKIDHKDFKENQFPTIYESMKQLMKLVSDEMSGKIASQREKDYYGSFYDQKDNICCQAAIWVKSIFWNPDYSKTNELIKFIKTVGLDEDDDEVFTSPKNQIQIQAAVEREQKENMVAGCAGVFGVIAAPVGIGVVVALLLKGIAVQLRPDRR